MIPDTLKQVADSVMTQQSITSFSQSVSYVVLALFIVIGLILMDKTVLSSTH